MTPTQLIESYLKGYNYTTHTILSQTTQRVGQVEHRIDVPANKYRFRLIFIGTTGIIINISSYSIEHSQVTVIPYADPDIKAKLRQILGPP